MVFSLQGELERNYHIFYQMCAARDDQAELAGLQLKPAEEVIQNLFLTSNTVFSCV